MNLIKKQASGLFFIRFFFHIFVFKKENKPKKENTQNCLNAQNA